MNQPNHRRDWTVAEAQSQLSELLRLAAEEGPQHIGADRPFVVVPAEMWYAQTQPHKRSQQPNRKPMGQCFWKTCRAGSTLNSPAATSPNARFPS